MVNASKYLPKGHMDCLSVGLASGWTRYREEAGASRLLQVSRMLPYVLGVG